MNTEQSPYDRGYDDCLKYNGNDPEEYNPYDVDSPAWMAYYCGWARGQEELDSTEELCGWCGQYPLHPDGYCTGPDCGEPLDDDMDGDWDTGMTSAGWGTDEDYGYYGE